ncbi:MAG: Lrp/AsnC ligand binding domain-containing protein [Thaumarchaeota archaeon]|nr:Lrp/AsnC ligand binding domain-containing protein [Nitrososphaerota archaeon]
MALKACILIKTTPPQTDEVMKKARQLNGVRKAFVAYGRFDLVAFAEGTTYDEIRKLTWDLNSIGGVRSTETLVEA